ncbi:MULTISPECIES: bifunctional glutamate N-acetyltransferase/amino-acid acetyltransferase ArgJ [Clostridium]|uniref:Arginine biosynthesis bifunctional protein ArgJ n=2 Tax=Clostridium TaxID=1485 RepID=D8GJQ2_CLOLD|nr:MULTISPECIES: bifunctional glutamate N-acetyltransferase/amino-acid acetyltransferase ArgJ [Clostridium]ADK15213.1 arginine biosynthesis bifunctional protein [Clostridium ljungdahlii DSM 13528]AGY74473.1 bifunctional glutamate N-acetyltransferase/amino-acid acetyltransferase ArgJ [Clostridium autoethanogenum DSM 10061]ALU34660.1 Arginine biosynthesis bifunctional protein ArgJ family [Clostridium autoethanogenum DSM 10061]OAA88693.1 Arginine biosynthesis bifunctional protein ArgJ [Clostridium
MNFEIIEGGVTSPKGFVSAGISCGIKKRNSKDLALIKSISPCNSAGVYTKNIVKGAPLIVTKKHLENKKAQAVIANSGNANTCTGEEGLKNAEEMCEYVARELKIEKEDVLVASTGIIGVKLNIEAIKNAVPDLVKKLDKDGYKDASKAIMTTDTFQKTIAIKLELGGKTVTIGVMAKGSGMIHPNMGTMLSFITTDVNIDPDLLDKALKESVRISYNRVSVDGDTSTNDMVVILANGLAENPLINEENEDYKLFLQALKKLNIEVAKMIAKDGEGATKLIECKALNVSSEEKGEILGKSVICSNLVKTALFGCNANWGRILDAIGYSGVEFDINKIQVTMKSKKGSVLVFEKGEPVPFSVKEATDILSEDVIDIIINFNSGNYNVCCWGCDLTYDYVKINGEYMS